MKNAIKRSLSSGAVALIVALTLASMCVFAWMSSYSRELLDRQIATHDALRKVEVTNAKIQTLVGHVEKIEAAVKQNTQEVKRLQSVQGIK